MSDKPGHRFKCAHCGREFETGRPDAEAMAEFERNFPGRPKEDLAVVCTDCYRLVLGREREAVLRAELRRVVLAKILEGFHQEDERWGLGEKGKSGGTA